MHALVEAALIAEFIDERLRTRNIGFVAGNGELEERTIDPGELHQALHRSLGVHLGQIADERLHGWLRNKGGFCHEITT